MKKNNIPSEEVKHIAKLAKLELTEKEILKLQKQLSSILDYVDQLKAVATEKTDPISQVTGLENVFREDIVTPSLPQEKVLSNTLSTYKGYFKVRTVFD